MSKVTTLSHSAITPEIILNSVAEDLGEMKHLFAVGIDKGGRPMLYASGDLSTLSIAALALQDLAMSYLNGGVTLEE